MARPCVCGGSNESCCWCYGTGVRSGSNHISPDVHRIKSNRRAIRATVPSRLTSQPQKTKQVAGAARAMVVCPKCRVSVSERRLSSHMMRVHPIVISQAGAMTGIGALAPDSRCLPTKPAPFRRLPPPRPSFDPNSLCWPPKTVSRRVRPLNSNQPFAKTTDAHGVTKKMIVCPRCRVPVCEVNLPRHLRKVHNMAHDSHGSGKRTKMVGSNGAHAQVSRTTASSREDNEVFQQRLERRMDATRDMGYPAREQGRYGSHPAHDAFHDESQP